MRLAIVGIRGLPNNYGGFETLAEYLVKFLSTEFDITVYCAAPDLDTRLKTWNGARLVYLPVSSHGGKGIVYDTLSLIHAVSKNDKVLLLGFGGGFVMPFLQLWKKKIIVNIGGLDWKRNKWSGLAQKIIKTAESLLMKYSGKIISDNIGIQNYITATYGRKSTLIAYGGDQAMHQPLNETWVSKYPFLAGKYAFSVCRIQPDNNIDMLLEAFKNIHHFPFVLVGNWGNSAYGIETKAKYTGRGNLILLEAIYERIELDVLRSNCTLYIHGHSAGGTNPSLAEAMFLGLPVAAFASGYNEFTTDNKAFYFKDQSELENIVKNHEALPLKATGQALKSFANEHYTWKKIAGKYKEVILS